MVSCDVRVQREDSGHLRSGGAGSRPDVEIDLAAGWISESGRDGGDGGSESTVGGCGRARIVQPGCIR
jgi:hypothetical protein